MLPDCPNECILADYPNEANPQGAAGARCACWLVTLMNAFWLITLMKQIRKELQERGVHAD
jgi:hypothetical protein